MEPDDGIQPMLTIALVVICNVTKSVLDPTCSMQPAPWQDYCIQQSAQSVWLI